MTRAGKITGVAFLFLVAGFALYVVYAMAQNQNTRHSGKTDLHFITSQISKDTSLGPYPMTESNEKVAAEALQALLDKCPELQYYAASIDPKSVQAMAVLDNTHQYMKLPIANGWPSYINVHFTLKTNSNDIDPDLINKGHDSPGETLGYLIGGGSNPGILVMKGINTHPQVGNKVCGQVITAFDIPHTFIADSRMQVIDRLN